MARSTAWSTRTTTPQARGLPWESDDYEFTSGVLSNEGKDVEFRVDVNRTTGQYSVSASELLEIKVRAAALFAGVSGKDLLANAERPGGEGVPSARCRSAGRGAAARPACTERAPHRAMRLRHGSPQLGV